MGCFSSKPRKDSYVESPKSSKEITVEDTVVEDPPTPALGPTEASKKLQAVIEDTINSPISKKIFRGELKLQSVNLDDGWQEFGFIPETTRCSKIDLSYSNFNDMQSLHNCKKMRILHLENATDGVDEAEYSFPHRLEELNIEGTEFTNWGALTSLKYFKKLLASGLEDLGEVQFEWPKSLEFLDFGATDFTDLNSLKDLPNLTHLDLRACDGDLSGKCPFKPGKLEFLDIEETNFDDVEFLKNLKATNKKLTLNCSYELKTDLGYSRKSIVRG